MKTLKNVLPRAFICILIFTVICGIVYTAACTGIAPVSYTHLDVYKRQSQASSQSVFEQKAAAHTKGLNQ